MGFQFVVDLDPPGVRDPVLISLSVVLASACIRLRFAPVERRRDMWRRESELYLRQKGTVQWRQLKACAAAVTTSSKTLQARRRCRQPRRLRSASWTPP